ncbi:TPA: phospho-N-acetylmuramoyl-pentapeptide-transferase [Candidatus Berkelbacteria bacterium]|uniref:Phospho-N-acetylmuramoyl-pentapeptide-transferase n=1 Tax=Berkelbacteria bacterium GW2011_GWE1_39_12 TaxID=1618337 RepID=A0A0G4B3D6_9BACT|nr:MAG: phospho-N-acetylmuramoyl-pentapeptide transferase [Berkelbacteria bacterium GW2011_GWE1_39_12]HBO60505.1 phospho-N-acetylmuramoyl-pentapeptide-transferase [Candidatus Berkelbacteria bacterium]
MEQIQLYIPDIAKVFWLTAISFVIALIWTPLFTDFLYKNKLGKRIRDTALDEKKAPIFYKLHKGKENTPTMGGLLVWVTTAVITLLFNLTRAGTWLPLFALVASGIIGAIDDLANIKGIGPNRGGLAFKYKFFLYLIIAVAGAWWFYFKLGWDIFHVPGLGDVFLGLWYIPLFIFVILFMAFSVNETDGLDGLAGGTLAISYGAYGFIALAEGKIALAAFCGTIMGALLAFLWFNVHPARFFMGDTGSMALGATLGIIAFLTNQVAVLPIIGFVFVLEAASVGIQLFSKKFFKRKVFLSSPIHHHFEALGWPESKVTMRFWIISAAMAVIGMMIALIGRGL